MKIKKRLWFNTVISLGTVSLILLSLAWSFREIFIADRHMGLAKEMRKVAFERILLRDEYLLYLEERAKTQWYSKTEALLGLFALADIHFAQEADKVLLKDARKYFDATVSGMSSVMEGYSKRDPEANQYPGFSDVEMRLISQVFLKAYSLTDNIDRLHESAQITATKAPDRGAFIVVIFILGGITAIIINSAVIRRTLAKRINVLEKGVELIGAGNLDHRIAAEGDDELTALALASNEMAAKLKQSYTSNEELEQRVIVRTAQLDAANKELEAFSYTVSHDLRAPLRHLIGFVELLNKRAPASPDEKTRHYLTVISDSATQMSLLIDDLLSFSRVRRVEMLKARVSIDKMVKEAMNILQTETGGRDIEWEIKPLPEVDGDSAMLRLVVVNLLSNAVKFTRTKTKAVIEVGCNKDDDAEHIFSVRDNGVGFDMRYNNKLFNLFQRLHCTEEFEGTGVGLANVRRIIQRHGGRTWAEGVLNEGATFFFSLPKQKEAI